MKKKRLIIMGLLLMMSIGFGGCKDNTQETAQTPLQEPIQEVFVKTPPEITYETYTGEVPHIFIHCLIADSSKKTNGLMRYDGVCINVAEYENMLNQLYENGYCLVDIYDTFTKGGEGKLHFLNEISVPTGKKPVIISVDDVVYDYKKRGNGMVDLLALDEKGTIMAGTYEADGGISYSHENEFVPILESFIQQHPDFSSHGARMTLAMTGFAGVFGYRTDTGNPDGQNRASEIKKATIIANRLKELGYSFASHSYGHKDANHHSTATMKRDLQKFQEEVVPIIGEVSVYVYPYGKPLNPQDEKYKAAQRYGFDLFCSVSHYFYRREYASQDTLYMTRIAVDGYSLRHYQTALSPLFDTEMVMDRENRL